jgi:hypothetical protein
MIDADEAVSRVRSAAEEATRREARREAEEQNRVQPVESPALDAELETVAHRAASAPTDEAPPPERDEMPIYAWIERAKPDESATDDWTRALVEAKEAGHPDETPPA